MSVCAHRFALFTVVAMILLAFPLPNDPSSFEREDARLRRHFATVLDELRNRDLTGWPAARRFSRAHQLESLGRYARAGLFPRNVELLRRTPIFVDPFGARCAMAYLIESSGGADLVRRVARTANHATIHELASDPELVAWLGQAGLDVEEAALIQPSYDFYQRKDDDDKVPSDGVMTSSVFVAACLGIPSIVVNLRESAGYERRARGAFGVLTGSGLLAAGIVDLSHDGHLRPQGYVDLAIGSIATGLGAMKLVSGRRSNAPSASGQENASDRVRWSLMTRSRDRALGIRATF